MRLIAALAFTIPLLAQSQGREWAVKNGRGEGHLQVGDSAPDFTLTKVKSSKIVQLSKLTRKRPVALVFGSYT